MADALKQNIEQASDYLERFRSAPLPHRIDGRSVLSASGDGFENASPFASGQYRTGFFTRFGSTIPGFGDTPSCTPSRSAGWT